VVVQFVRHHSIARVPDPENPLLYARISINTCAPDVAAVLLFCSDNIAFSVSYSVSSRLKYSVITWISSNAPDYLMDHMISSRLKEYFVVISDTFTVLK